MKSSSKNPFLSPLLGYQLAQTDDAIQGALQRAFDFIRRGRRAGGEVRAWSKKATRETEELLRRHEHQGRPENASSQKSVLELAAWETRILQNLRTYIGETATLTNLLKRLNPPLTSAQLRPFHEALTVDRLLTMSSLERLTEHAGRLTRIKTGLTL